MGTGASPLLLNKTLFEKALSSAHASGISSMACSAPIKLRPFATDVAISRACLRVASPAVERPLSVVTWLADEKILLGAVGVFWAATRLSPSRPLRREADAMLCSVLIAGMMPDLFKYLVRRERPNRALVRRHDKRAPRLGNAWDSFPSGHAMHLSAIGVSAQRLVPPRWRAPLWSALGTLAATRIVLLAYYPSDVLAGWGIGALINKTVCAAFGRAERAKSERAKSERAKSERVKSENVAAATPLQPY
jgi:membrane-associated phospholipid phosphatase